MLFSIHLGTKLTGLLIRPQPIMLKILLIMLLSSAHKITHYAQYYAHHHFNFVTDYTQFIIFNDSISIDRLQPVSYYVAALLYFKHIAQQYMLMQNLCLILHQVYMIIISQINIFIYKVMISMSTNRHLIMTFI